MQITSHGNTITPIIPLTPKSSAAASTSSPPPASPAVSSAESTDLILRSIEHANQFSCLGENDFIDFTQTIADDVPGEDKSERSGFSKAGEAIATGVAHRTILYPLDLITTRLMLGSSSKGNYFQGLGTNIATGAIGKAASLGSNKVIRDVLEQNNVQGASILAGVAAGGFETALNPLSVIAQQAKMLPRGEVIPALSKMPLRSYYKGGGPLIAQNVLGAGIWYHGNALVRNPEDPLAIEAGKSAAICTAASLATWPIRLMRVQRIGINDVSPTYTEIVQRAIKEGFVKGLKLNALFPTGLLRVVISGAILGPLMNRFNEKE